MRGSAANEALMAIPAQHPTPIHAEARDLDGDGQEEVLLDNGHLRLVLAPADGGRLREWTVRAADGAALNLFSGAGAADRGSGLAPRLTLNGAQPTIQPGL